VLSLNPNAAVFREQGGVHARGFRTSSRIIEILQGYVDPPGELKISYYDGLQFADAKYREQFLPPTAFAGFNSVPGAAKDPRVCSGSKGRVSENWRSCHRASRLQKKDSEPRQNPVLSASPEFNSLRQQDRVRIASALQVNQVSADVSSTIPAHFTTDGAL
jgi:hypothetical protein